MFRRHFDPATAVPSASLLYAIRNAREVSAGRLPPERLGVSAPDERTVVIDLEHPAPFLPELFAHRGLPVPRHVVTKWGDQWTRPEHIVSNGAFVFGEWRPGSHEAAAQSALPRGGRRAHRCDLPRPVEDPKAALARYRAGELDVVVNLPSEQLDELRRDFGTQLHLVRQIGLEYLAFNTRRAPLADARVRRALSMAVDRELLSARILRAGEPPAYGLVPPGVDDYPRPARADFAAWPMARRLAQARELLAQAGYGPGRPLLLRYRYNNNDTQRRIALAVSAMWQALGVRTELLTGDLKAHQQAITQGDFDVARGAWYAEDRDAGSFLELLRSGAGALNVSGFRDQGYDALLDQADAAAEVQRRAELRSQAEAIAMAAQPIAPLYIYVGRRLVAPRVQGWVDNARGVTLDRYLSVAPSRRRRSRAIPRPDPRAHPRGGRHTALRREALAARAT
ncbi:MAG: peptide ABC transporter substrate-binding protein [Steroidobacteraceae bacterium]